MVSLITAIISFLALVGGWALKPSGYREWKNKKQVEALRKEYQDAVDRNDWDIANRVNAQLDELQKLSG